MVFPEGGYGSVKRAYCSDTFLGYYDKKPTPGIVSFFKGDDGYEYIAIVNNSRKEAGSISLDFDKSVKKAEVMYYNGERTAGIERCAWHQNQRSGAGRVSGIVGLYPRL